MKSKRYLKPLTDRIYKTLNSHKADAYYCIFVSGAVTQRLALEIKEGDIKNALGFGLVDLLALYGAYYSNKRNENSHLNG